VPLMASLVDALLRIASGRRTTPGDEAAVLPVRVASVVVAYGWAIVALVPVTACRDRLTSRPLMSWGTLCVQPEPFDVGAALLDYWVDIDAPLILSAEAGRGRLRLTSSDHDLWLSLS